MDLEDLQQHSKLIFIFSIFFMFITAAVPDISKMIALFVSLPSSFLYMILEIYLNFIKK